MAQAYFSLVTNAGKIKLAQSAAGGDPVVITHFAVGDGNGAETNPTAASTTLVREVWRTPVESVIPDPENPSAVLITAIIPTSAGGWWMREFGIFDAGGAMIAVAKPVSQYKPTALEGQLEDIRYEFQIIIGESANVTLLVDPSLLFATRSWVENRKIPMAQMMRLPWLPVISMTTTAPPAVPAQGDTYLVPAGATGVWAGNTGKIVEWTGNAWSYSLPPDGHGLGLPDGRVFERIAGVYVEFLASRDWVSSRTQLMAKLNRLPWLSVVSMTATAPPGAPADGDLYLVPAGATGVWAANVGKIAEWTGAAWAYVTPPDGHGIALPDGRVFERVAGVYVEKLALDAQSGKWGYAVAAGTANSIGVTLTPTPPALVNGMTLRLRLVATNTGPATLNLNSLGGKPIVNVNGVAVRAGDLVPGIVEFIYDSNTWIVVSTLARFFELPSGKNVRVITATENWTVPDGVSTVRTRLVGGGGGGGGGNTSTPNRGGGGASGGGYAEKLCAVTLGQVIACTVGAGGAKGVSYNATPNALGGTGGTTSFGSLVSATGGLGGSNNGTAASTGGAGVGGDVNFTGAGGLQGMEADGARYGAPGGVAPMVGGASASSTADGYNATGFGAGGGGGAGINNYGGLGAPGIIILEW